MITAFVKTQFGNLASVAKWTQPWRTKTNWESQQNDVQEVDCFHFHFKKKHVLSAFYWESRSSFILMWEWRVLVQIVTLLCGGPPVSLDMRRVCREREWRNNLQIYCQRWRKKCAKSGETAGACVCVSVISLCRRRQLSLQCQPVTCSYCSELCLVTVICRGSCF